MRVRPWLLTAVMCFAGLLGTAAADPQDTETVKAFRYRVYMVESVMDWAHGRGRWVEELWFPDRKFAANVTTKWNDGKEAPVASAFFCEVMRNWAQTSGLETEREQPVEAVTVPRALADRLFALAEAARRLEEERAALGPRIVAEKALRALPDDREFRVGAGKATPESSPELEVSADARAWLAEWAEPVGKDVDPVTRFPSRVRRKRDGGEMVLIPRGPFEFGREVRSGSPGASRSAELSKAYYLDVDEVTVAKWRGFVEATKAPMPDLGGNVRATEPMRNVTHPEATEYARWVGCVLPTEAQWERAARADVRFAGFANDAYHDRVEQRNGAGSEDGFAGVAPVGSFPPNGWGLRDLAGNVAEWCADGFGPFPGEDGVPNVGPEVLVDPVGPSDRLERVVKGGSYLVSGGDLSIGHREALKPEARRADVGFRTVRTLP